MPDLSYSLTGQYDAGIASLGVTAVGQTDTVSGGYEWEGKTLFNLNGKIRPIENLEVGVSVYNLFDTFDGRGNGTGVVSDAGNNSIVTVTPALGRTVSGSVRFSF